MHTNNLKLLLTLVIFLFLTLHQTLSSSQQCSSSCNSIPIHYPFALSDGCGAPQFRHTLNCTPSGLSLHSPSGSYSVQSIDYSSQTLTLYDPTLSTCSLLQPPSPLLLSPSPQTLSPSPDTVFALLNCSPDSPILNKYTPLCLNNLSGHQCQDLYNSCTAFRVFNYNHSSDSGTSCCFVDYSVVRYIGLSILDCSHYTAVYGVEGMRGLGPEDWEYGVRMAYGLPEAGCERCRRSGGGCGFDTETEGMVCLCSSEVNSTRECAAGTVTGGGGGHVTKEAYSYAITFVLGAFLFFT